MTSRYPFADKDNDIREVEHPVLTNSFCLQTVLGVNENAQVLQQEYCPLDPAAQWGPLVWGVEGAAGGQQHWPLAGEGQACWTWPPGS